MNALASPTVAALALAYLVLTLAIGTWAAKRTRNAKDFFIAGQGIGVVVMGVATMSASFSGFIFLGGPGLMYRMGIASLFISMSLSFTAALLCWAVGRRLRLLAEVREIYTVPDAVYHRYRSRRVQGLAAVAVVVGTVGYLGAQLLALGRLVEAVFGTREMLGEWSLPIAMAVGSVVLLAYAVAGGMVAGVYTDFVQGVLMLGAAVAVFGYALRSGGGFSAMTESITGSDLFGPDFLNPLASAPVLTALGFFFVFGIGTLGQPHMLHKFYMLKDPRQLRWLPLILGGSQSVCVLLWLGVGLAVPALVARGELAPLATPDDAAPLFLLDYTPEILAGVVVAGILAAVMSTADSFVNIASAALVRDLPRAFGRPLKRELFWGRWATGIVALAAGVLAYAYDDLIALLGTFAFGTFAAALAPALGLGLLWRRVTARAAGVSIAVGTILNLTLELLARQSFFPSWPKLPLAAGVPPTAVSLAASLAILCLMTWWGRDGAEEELDPAVERVLES
ncbi:MAG: hypothetical protein AAGD01_19305 [Acidobacteriota bacterium]